MKKNRDSHNNHNPKSKPSSRERDRDHHQRKQSVGVNQTHTLITKISKSIPINNIPFKINCFGYYAFYKVK